MNRKHQKGQALLLVITAFGIFVIGALGLAIDGAQLYGHRQMAQSAADAAAQSGIQSLFTGSNAGGAAGFTTSSFTCTTTDTRTPCVYARLNGFGGTANDTVSLSFPTSVAGTSLWGGTGPGTTAPVGTVIQASVTRNVPTMLMRLLGVSAATSVRAVASAAIVDVVSPTPILITHPTKSGAFSANGNPTIKICGGPSRSIQVNSNSSTAISTNSNTTVDLSQAGPAGNASCVGGTGADFGSFGRPSTPTFSFSGGSLPGKYVQPAAPIQDPLASVPAPPRPTVAGSSASLANGVSGCPVSPPKACQLYSPGYFPKIEVKNETAVFKPGIYYIEGGGFQNAANGDIYMATGFPNHPDTGQGMLVYNTGTVASPTAAGAITIGSNSNANMLGSCSVVGGNCSTNTYKGILFFQNRASVAKTHSLGGNGCMALTGTIYLTNTLATMTSTPAQFQTLDLQGTPCSGTAITGQIIVSALHLGGNATLRMALSPAATLHVRQISLVR